MTKALIPLLLLISTFTLSARSNAKNDSAPDTADAREMLARMDTFHYQRSGHISLGTVASLDIPKGFKYLDGPQAASVLHDVWRNPYALSLGMLFPENTSPFDPNCWAVDITYDENGHVKDDDARDMKYDELLKQMQDQVKASNPERTRQGSPAMELIGWAEPPYYDSKAHKLYWAKKLKDLDDSMVFLNYNIRVLGRKGVLILNAIGNPEQLAEIKSQTPTILDATNFSSGNTYGEFNSSVDKVAAYGIAGLIAGGILAKTGLFAKLGLLLLKFLKPLLVAFAGIGAWVMRFFRGRREEQ